MSEDEADLALLAAGNGPPLLVPPFNDYQAVCLFLDQHGIAKGEHRSIEVCTLYRLYRGWQEGQAEEFTVRPFSFAKQLKRMGFRKRHDKPIGWGRRHDKRPTVNKDAMVLLTNKPGAFFLRSWRSTHPDTPEYRDSFRRLFVGPKGSSPASHEWVCECGGKGHGRTPGERDLFYRRHRNRIKCRAWRQARAT